MVRLADLAPVEEGSKVTCTVRLSEGASEVSPVSLVMLNCAASAPVRATSLPVKLNVASPVLVIVIVLMGAYGWYFKNLAPEEQELWKGSSWIFLLESIGVIAFAISWLAKGRSLRSLQNLANRFRGSKA